LNLHPFEGWRGEKLKRNKIKFNRLTVGRSKNLKYKLFLLFLAPILISSLYIWQRVTVITLSSQNKELRVEIKQRQRVLDYLQVEVARLSSIDRIEKTIGSLGFVQPPFDSVGVILEYAEAPAFDTLGEKENIWAKLKALQKNLLSGDQVEAKEIKHER
jgi:cell division protein FtsL